MGTIHFVDASKHHMNGVTFGDSFFSSKTFALLSFYNSMAILQKNFNQTRIKKPNTRLQIDGFHFIEY